MKTHLIAVEVDLRNSTIALQQAILAELQKHGEPLRWAVTDVNAETRKAGVEAIVTTQND
jgi:hypothetical protein